MTTQYDSILDYLELSKASLNDEGLEDVAEEVNDLIGFIKGKGELLPEQKNRLYTILRKLLESNQYWDLKARKELELAYDLFKK